MNGNVRGSLPSAFGDVSDEVMSTATHGEQKSFSKSSLCAQQRLSGSPVFAGQGAHSPFISQHQHQQQQNLTSPVGVQQHQLNSPIFSRQSGQSPFLAKQNCVLSPSQNNLHSSPIVGRNPLERSSLASTPLKGSWSNSSANRSGSASQSREERRKRLAERCVNRARNERKKRLQAHRIQVITTSDIGDSARHLLEEELGAEIGEDWQHEELLAIEEQIRQELAREEEFLDLLESEEQAEMEYYMAMAEG